MDLRTVRRSMIDPALLLLPAKMESPQAVVMLLAIGLQESRFEYRRQMGNGPAKSFWQAEQGGGMVTGLLRYRVDDIRDAQLPKLAEVKPQIAQELQKQKLQKFQEDLRAKAKVE